MSEELSGDMIFDTSVLMELIIGGKGGRKLSEDLRSEVLRASTTEINVVELRYILCRKVGRERAQDVVGKILGSGYLKVSPISDIAEEAGSIKCMRAISFVDCFTLALGRISGSKVLFSKHEKDLDREIKKLPFDVTILFLEDLIH